MRSAATLHGLICLAVILLGGAGYAGAQEGAEEAASETAPSESGGSAVFSPEVEAILSETPDGEDYGAMEKCIQARSIRGSQVLDDKHIVFEMPSRKYYLVQFEHSCHMMRPDVTIAYEPRGSQLCRMDFIRAVDSFGPGSVGPPCSIPGFYPVTREQVALLKESLKARRRAEVDALKAEKARKKAERKAEKEAANAALPETDDAGH